MVQYKTCSSFFLMRKVQWHNILLCRKNKIKKVPPFLFSPLFCSRQRIKKMIHSLAFFIPLAEGTKGQTWIKQHVHIWLFASYIDTKQLEGESPAGQYSQCRKRQRDERVNVLMWPLTNSLELLIDPSLRRSSCFI